MGIEEQFEYLAVGYEKTSEYDGRYNCIAHAARRADKWWWPTAPVGGHPYWPSGVPRQETLAAFQAAFETLGYQVCKDPTLEADTEKVAIFAIGSTPTHAARQLPNGKWSSKLGKGIDVSHALLSLNGAQYGIPVLFMARPRPKPAPKPKKKRRLK